MQILESPFQSLEVSIQGVCQEQSLGRSFTAGERVTIGRAAVYLSQVTLDQSIPGFYRHQAAGLANKLSRVLQTS